MSREIKFRGRSVVTGEWVYGSLIQATPQGATCIYDENQIIHSVDAETVGQFTGGKGKKEAPIFEGDIVYQEFNDMRSVDHGGFIGVVRQLEGCWVIDNLVNHSELLWSEVNENEVIGNRFDNPELIQGD
ncbi:YopX family protein [Bacillus sp. Hm123]|uniref:YopX family protein n=1 Tax=Bacillus sp. Hm123 TaxID=3450745 RepID=UPI003F43EDD0